LTTFYNRQQYKKEKKKKKKRKGKEKEKKRIMDELQGLTPDLQKREREYGVAGHIMHT